MQDHGHGLQQFLPATPHDQCRFTRILPSIQSPLVNSETTLSPAVSPPAEALRSAFLICFTLRVQYSQKLFVRFKRFAIRFAVELQHNLERLRGTMRQSCSKGAAEAKGGCTQSERPAKRKRTEQKIENGRVPAKNSIFVLAQSSSFLGTNGGCGN
jgi:hypothetical protein